jgi:hypothetical protein
MLAGVTDDLAWLRTGWNGGTVGYFRNARVAGLDGFAPAGA